MASATRRAVCSGRELGSSMESHAPAWKSRARPGSGRISTRLRGSPDGPAVARRIMTAGVPEQVHDPGVVLHAVPGTGHGEVRGPEADERLRGLGVQGTGRSREDERARRQGGPQADTPRRSEPTEAGGVDRQGVVPRGRRREAHADSEAGEPVRVGEPAVGGGGEHRAHGGDVLLHRRHPASEVEARRLEQRQRADEVGSRLGREEGCVGAVRVRDHVAAPDDASRSTTRRESRAASSPSA